MNYCSIAEVVKLSKLPFKDKGESFAYKENLLEDRFDRFDRFDRLDHV
jgi:hypothetical protein